MSKNILIKELQKELSKLNDLIDLKIIRGLSYKKEAKRHKFLLNQLNALNGRPKVRIIKSENWMYKIKQSFLSLMF